jgi:tRNAThr (cytosine32-N3)-methyltransferase
MTASVAPDVSVSNPDLDVASKLGSLLAQYPSKQPERPDAVGELPPAHRCHDPQHNMKRTDPFQFGSRLLKEEDNVFEFNAWDHVETDDTYKEYSELQYAKQREAPVSDFDKSTCSHLILHQMCPNTLL